MCDICSSLEKCPDYIVQMIEKQLVAKEQRSDEWLLARRRMITASDVPTLLGENYPQNPSNLLYQKTLGIIGNDRCGSTPQNEAMMWGTKWESDAAEEFKKRTGHKVVFTGLLRHATIETLGASPDGITWCGCALEIKCPFKKIGKSLKTIPQRYKSQVETQLSVTGFQKAYFVQYRPPGYGDEGVTCPENTKCVFFCLEYNRDKNWEDHALPIIERFSNDMHRVLLSYEKVL